MVNYLLIPNRVGEVHPTLTRLRGPTEDEVCWFPLWAPRIKK